MTTARTRQQVSPLTVEIASLIDGAMASRRPKMSQLDLARETGIGQSQLSRMLAPTKPMFVEEFIAICRVLTLDPMVVIREAEKRAAGSVARTTTVHPVSDVDITLAEPVVDEPAPHSSPVSARDIAAGGVLPMQGGRPRPRRSRQTSDTTEKHHK